MSAPRDPENIVFTVGPDELPAIRYRTIPRACSGFASTLAEARASYRGELTGLLNVERHELPPVIEHVEAKVHGLWVREKVGAVHRDCRADRMLLQTLLAPGEAQAQLRAHVAAAADAGVEPVVVLVEPNDTVASVLDQMAPEDAVVVAYADPADPTAEIAWAAVYGPEAKGACDIPVVVDDDIREMPIGRFAGRYRASGVPPAARCTDVSLRKAG